MPLLEELVELGVQVIGELLEVVREKLGREVRVAACDLRLEHRVGAHLAVLTRVDRGVMAAGTVRLMVSFCVELRGQRTGTRRKQGCAQRCSICRNQALNLWNILAPHHNSCFI